MCQCVEHGRESSGTQETESAVLTLGLGVDFALNVVLDHLDEEAGLHGENSGQHAGVCQFFMCQVGIKLTSKHVESKVGNQVAGHREKQLHLLWREQASIFIELLCVKQLQEFEDIEDYREDEESHQW